MSDQALSNAPSARVNPELERSLLAALAMDPTAYFDVKSIVTSDIFTTQETIQAFNEITSAYEENRAMPKLSDWSPVTNHIDTARELFELWQRRQLEKLPLSLASDMDKQELSADDILTNMQNEVNRVQALIGDQRADKAVSASTLFSEVLQGIKKRKGEGFGVNTGLEKLDDMIGGLQPALHLLAGAPGLGKTTLSLQISANVAAKGIPVLFVTFDEVLWRLTLKSFCAKSGLTAKEFADGKFEDDQFDELQKAYEEHQKDLQNLHFIEGSSRLEVANLESLARQAMRRQGNADTCLVIVDYLQRWASLKAAGQFEQIVGRLVGQLREMAFRLNAPVIVVSSLDRKGYTDPTITDLKETGELEFAADTAWLLRENTRGTQRMKDHVERGVGGQALPRALRINLAKNRYGQLGEVHLMFDLQKGKIIERS